MSYTIEKINGWTIIADRFDSGILFKRRYMGYTKRECIDRFISEYNIYNKQEVAV